VPRRFPKSEIRKETNMTTRVRQPSQAGRFYDGNAATLRAEVDGYLTVAERDETLGRPIGLVSPHAGYQFSGPTAAYAFKQTEGHTFRRVIVAAPSHSSSFLGACVFDGEAYATPLGEIRLDLEFIQQLTERSDLVTLSVSEGSHEHSLEVQLPFLQRAVKDFQLVPLLLSRLNGEDSAALAETLKQVIDEQGGAEETLLVASSDLYHGHDYEECKRQDARLAKAVTSFDVEAFETGCRKREFMACGSGPVALVMRAARLLGATQSRVVHQTTSRDASPTGGSYVVGYLAAVFA
jgi:AmmeMemoRadiSam system protein B